MPSNIVSYKLLINFYSESHLQIIKPDQRSGQRGGMASIGQGQNVNKVQVNQHSNSNMRDASAPGLTTKPSMNEIKHDNYDPFNYANLKNVDPQLAQQISEAVEKKFIGKFYQELSIDFSYFLFADVDPSEWASIYKLKLKFCYRHANFQADPKKHPEQVEFKE